MTRIIPTYFVTFFICISVHSQSAIDWSTIKFKNDSTGQTQEYVITTKSGRELVGELLRIKNDRLVIQTGELGELSLALGTIKSIKAKEDTPTLSMVGVNHYLLGSTPYGLEKGEGNFQISQIFLISGWYGFSNNFTLGSGFTILPAIKFREQLFYLIPKYSVDLSKQIVASAQLATAFFQGESASLLTFSTGFGRSDNNLSLGYSTVLTNSGEGDINDIVGDGGLINAGLILRMGSKFAFLWDGTFSTAGDGNLVTLGGRFIGEGSSFDFGFLMAGIPIPWFNFTQRF